MKNLIKTLDVSSLQVIFIKDNRKTFVLSDLIFGAHAHWVIGIESGHINLKINGFGDIQLTPSQHFDCCSAVTLNKFFEKMQLLYDELDAHGLIDCVESSEIVEFVNKQAVTSIQEDMEQPLPAN